MNFKLQSGGNTDRGTLQVTNANNVITWGYKAPGGNGFTNMTTPPQCSSVDPTHPQAGDTLNVSGCSVISGGAMAGSATYTSSGPGNNGKPGFYYTAPPSPKNTSPNDWDAQDSGSGK
jgi:hypothetical protein